jgi:hypothetical protein
MLTMHKERSVQGGSQPSRRSPGDLNGLQSSHDELGQLTRLYETLTNSSPLLRRGPLSTIRHFLTHSPSRGLAESLNIGVVQQAIKYAILVIVVAVSFLVSVNLERFTDYAAQVPDLYRLAIYHLLGQAEADKRVYEEQARIEQEQIRQQQEAELQLLKHEKEIARQHANEEQVRLTRIERIRAITAAWQEFLTNNRGRFKYIELINDQYHNENCLRIRNTLWDFISPTKPRMEIARQMAEVATYQIRDAISDGFVEWLNADHVLNRADWRYADLQNMETEFSAGCLSPDQVWRTNRYYEPNDIGALIVPGPM